MIKITFIAINILLAIFLYFLNIWFEEEAVSIQNINSKYISDTRKLKEIEKINKWLDENVKKNLVNIPKNSEDTDIKLIHFFDVHAKEYGFSVEKFIYNDGMAHFLNIHYSLSRDNYKNLLKFMSEEYRDGYIFIKTFTLDKRVLSGELIVIQPYSSEIKKSDKEDLDDVPQ